VNERLSVWWLGTLSILVALMPLSFSVPFHAKALPLLVFLLTGLGLIFSRPFTRRGYRNIWPIMATSALTVGFTVLNILGHQLGAKAGWSAFDLPSHILLFMATAAVFTLPLRMRWIWIGFSLTAIVLGASCIWQHFYLRFDRAFGLNGGGWGAIEFAMVLLVLSLSAWLQVFYARTGVLEKSLHGVAACFGMYGALLTQSRGPLLAFAAVLLLLLLLYAKRTRGWWSGFLMLVAILGGAILASGTVHDFSNPTPDAAPATLSAAAPPVASTSKPPASAPTAGDPSESGSSPVFVKRFADVGSEVATYNSKTDASGAVRERLEMWHTAGHALEAHPLTGVGTDQFGVYIREQVAAGRANAVIAKYDHPHNEYLEAAATGGIPGLLVLLLVFGVPLTYFFRHALRARDNEIIPASVGLALVSMYVLCSLTDNVFYRAMPHSFYFFTVCGLAMFLGRSTPTMETAARG
jgi:O-antigen ligase